MLRLRKNTVDRVQDTKIIDIFKQHLIGILGIRGSGKSVLGEALLERYYDAGFTCLDLWSAPNMENAFWIFAREGHKKRIPITILTPEAFIYPEAQVDRFNGDYLTREPLVKFVKLPTPTKKTDSEPNERILEILIKTIVECRDKRRILVFNPYLFPNETEMFRVLEILMRNLITISNNYFDAIKPEEVGVKTKEEMTTRQRTHHRMCFLIREFGEVSPARLKGDKSGESTLIKKALLKFVRLARHSSIDGIVDYQNASDADSAIRNQISFWLVKRWTPELAGEQFEYIFKKIEKKRDVIFQKNGYNDASFKFADSVCPPIEKLSYFWYYVCKSGDDPKLRKVPTLHIKHKEPDDKWWKITGIPIEYDRDMLSKTNVSSSSKESKSNDRLLYLTINDMKMGKGKKKMNWTKITEAMAEKQQKGEITYHLSFSNMKPNTLGSIFSRMKKKHQIEENESE